MAIAYFGIEELERHPSQEFGELGVYFVSRTGGTRRGGATHARKTTARGGKRASKATRHASHLRRSVAGGESAASPGGNVAPKVASAHAPEPRRGPGAVGQEGGHAQAAAGKGRR